MQHTPFHGVLATFNTTLLAPPALKRQRRKCDKSVGHTSALLWGRPCPKPGQYRMPAPSPRGIAHKRRAPPLGVVAVRAWRCQCVRVVVESTVRWWARGVYLAPAMQSRKRPTQAEQRTERCGSATKLAGRTNTKERWETSGRAAAPTKDAHMPKDRKRNNVGESRLLNQSCASPACQQAMPETSAEAICKMQAGRQTKPRKDICTCADRFRCPTPWTKA